MNLRSTSPHLVAIDLSRRRLIVHDAKGQKGRVVYLSYNAVRALDDYLTVRPSLSTQRVFSVEKGTNRDDPLSVRGFKNGWCTTRKGQDCRGIIGEIIGYAGRL
jgi:site-specific recombinase XerD